MTPLGSAPRRAERGEEEASTQQLTGGGTSELLQVETLAGGEQRRASLIITTRATQPGGINHEVIFITVDTFISHLY